MISIGTKITGGIWPLKKPEGQLLYASDFSAGADGWINGNNGVVQGNVDGVGGWNNVLKGYANGANADHSIFKILSYSAGHIYRCRFNYFIPNGQSNVVALRPVWYASENSEASVVCTHLGAWRRVDFFFVPQNSGAGLLELRLHNGPLLNDYIFQGLNDPDDDRIFIRDFIFSDIT